MIEQRLSNFYTPNVSTAFNIKKRNLSEQLADTDQKMEEEYYDCSFMLESEVTDFWVTKCNIRT